MAVTQIPMPNNKALEVIRYCVENNLYRLPKFPSNSWVKVVTRRQIMLCMEKGEIVEALPQEYGKYLYLMRRLSAGVLVQIKVALSKDKEWMLRVVEVTTDVR